MTGPDSPDIPDHQPDATVDPVDELLRRRVREAAPTAPTSEAAAAELVGLSPRFRRARHRRQAAVAALSSAAVVVLVVAGSFALGDGDPQRLDTAGEDRTSTSTTSSSSTTTSSTTSTTSSTVPPTVTSVPPTTTSIPSPGPDPTVPGGGTGSVAPGPPPTSPVVTVAPTIPLQRNEVLSAAGGSATVRWSVTSIEVLGTIPAAGWTLEEVEQRSPTRVVVKFRRDEGGPGSSSSTIDARVVDGVLDVNS